MSAELPAIVRHPSMTRAESISSRHNDSHRFDSGAVVEVETWGAECVGRDGMDSSQ